MERFKYRFDRRSRRITIGVIVALAIAFGAFIYLGHGSYLPAWFLSIVIATMALYILSIPRFITLDTEAESVEIHCLLELTKISVGDLSSIRRVENEELKSTFPLLGSYGFFGYYGYYFNFKEWEVLKVYASEWSNFVEIVDIYEQKYIISCDRADELIALVESAKQTYASEHEQ